MIYLSQTGTKYDSFLLLRYKEGIFVRPAGADGLPTFHAKPSGAHWLSDTGHAAACAWREDRQFRCAAEYRAAVAAEQEHLGLYFQRSEP